MTTNKTFITKAYNDSTVLVFRNDGWFNMTKAANAFGKDLGEFMESPQTVEHINGLSKYFSDEKFFVTKYGSARHPSAGTWAHPKLAVLFGYWIGIKFGVWCELAIDDILRTHRAQEAAAKCARSAGVGSITSQSVNEMLKQIQEVTAKLQAQTRTINEIVARLKKLTCVDIDDTSYMTVDEYLESIGVHNLSDARKKKIEEVAAAYCQDCDENF